MADRGRDPAVVGGAGLPESPPATRRRPRWRKRAVALVDANIDANQNHPSILVWSIGNELGSPPARRRRRHPQQAAAAANRLDPTRPVGMVDRRLARAWLPAGVRPLQVIGSQRVLRLVRHPTATADDRGALGPFTASVRACYPNQAIFVTEFGFGGNRNGPVEVRGTYSVPDQLARSITSASSTLCRGCRARSTSRSRISPRARDFVGGDPLGTPPWVDKGVLDQYGNPKPSFAVMASLYKGFEQIGPVVLPALRSRPTGAGSAQSA